MKQGIFVEIVKWYGYTCPFCGKYARISEKVWKENYLRKCFKCKRVFGTDPDYHQTHREYKEKIA